MKTLTKSQIKDAVAEAYALAKEIKGGKNADYIPYLAKVPPELLAISVTLPDGDTIAVGDSDYCFGIESISKVLTAALVLQQSGADSVLKKIGADATGLPFNSVMAILLENNSPSTPLVNAGAIASCSMVTPKGDSVAKWRAIGDFMSDLCGSPLKLLEELYKSESDTNFNNRAIAWLLMNYSRMYDDVPLSLDLYTRQCSMGVTARQLSICGATIAMGGLNPVTLKRVMDSDLCAKLTSLVATVGFYQNTGEWMYSCGIPAKTGVGGGVMGILPGVMGIAAFSPPLDGAGNSLRAQAAIRQIANRLEINIFSDQGITID